MKLSSTEEMSGGDPFRKISERLRHPMLVCPQCRQTWLIIGARQDDLHMCKACGHRFRVGAFVAER